jgi:hypothetical protein
MKYQRKPEYIEAIQWTGHNGIEEILRLLNISLTNDCDYITLLKDGCLLIRKGLQTALVPRGDYISERWDCLYVYPKESFERDYEIFGEKK